jgi:hypothetical protein
MIDHNEKVGDTASKRTSTRTLVVVFKRGLAIRLTLALDYEAPEETVLEVARKR